MVKIQGWFNPESFFLLKKSTSIISDFFYVTSFSSYSFGGFKPHIEGLKKMRLKHSAIHGKLKMRRFICAISYKSTFMLNFNIILSSGFCYFFSIDKKSNQKNLVFTKLFFTPHLLLLLVRRRKNSFSNLIYQLLFFLKQNF
jgi:hypothetical protein